MFPILYKYTSTDKVFQWQIFVTKEGYYTKYGYKGGKITTSAISESISKNIGKKTETTQKEQALIDATNFYNTKLREGFNIKLIKNKIFYPMAARSTDDLSKITEPFKYRMFIQPKLDGIRCVNKKQLFSKTGKTFISCPHLIQSKVLLDGELYNHKYKHDFNELESLITSEILTKKDFEETKEKIEYHIYDFPEYKSLPFIERYEKLKQWFKTNKNPQIKLVETIEVFSLDDIQKYTEYFESLGYEGAMLRVSSLPYQNKVRSKQLIKIKKFIDEEFKIVGYIEGKGKRKGTIGKFWLQNDPNKPYDIKKYLNVFKCDVKGKPNYLKDIWDNKEKYLNKTGTVKYFNRTPITKKGGNIPRFGKIIKFDRESYE